MIQCVKISSLDNSNETITVIKGMGDRLGKLRADMRLSQKEVGELVGVSPSSIGGYESGDRVPSLDVLISLSRVFHTTTDFILLGIKRDTDKIVIDTTRLEDDQVRLIKYLLNILEKKSVSK